MPTQKENYARVYKDLIAHNLFLYIIVTIVWTVIYLAPLAPGLLIRSFLNTLLAEATVVHRIIILLTALAVIHAGVIVIGCLTDIKLRFCFSSILRINLVKSLLNSYRRDNNKEPTGEIINRLRDDVNIIVNTTDWFIDFFANVMFTLIAFLILLRLNILITVVIFLPLTVLVAITRVLDAKLVKRRKKARGAAGSVSRRIYDFLSAAITLKANNAEKKVSRLIFDLNAARKSIELKDITLTQIIFFLSSNVTDIGTGMILLFYAFLQQSASFQVGDFSLFVYYLIFITRFTEFSGHFLTQLIQCRISISRLFSLLNGPAETLTAEAALYLEHEPEISETKPVPPFTALQKLVVENLSYRYPDSTTGGISDISFELEPGTVTVITGEIGSGKSTLIKSLLGILKPQQGQIKWNNQAIASPQDFFIPPVCAYTPQSPHFFNASFYSNAVLGDKECPEFEQYLELTRLDVDVKTFQSGVHTKIGTDGKALSGGQRKRLAMLRLLCRNSQLVVLDNFSTALDRETSQYIWKGLLTYAKTFLIVSYDEYVIEQADNILVLEKGRLAAQGKLSSLLTRNVFIQHLFQHNKSIAPRSEPIPTPPGRCSDSVAGSNGCF